MSLQKIIIVGWAVTSLLAWQLAGVLARRLSSRSVDVYKSAGMPSDTDWYPFWVIRFALKGSVRRLDAASSLLAVSTALLLVGSLIFMATLVAMAIF
jgi:hypothetical protein